MSANNQAVPAAALAAAAASSAASSSASAAAASEYLKRTCLICGCQTNQTINIYEPRSGPNIVQLIQAKFKFQPLNEDKFLCFSCNNWLINWHSLQALNSNEAESQSRSQSPSHMGNNSSAGLVQQEQLQLGASQGQPVRLRPVAQVRPQPQLPPQSRLPAAHTPTPTPPPPALSYTKRCRFVRRGRHPSLAKQTRRPLRRSLCRESDRQACKWRRLHRRSMAKLAQLQRQLSQQQAELQQQVQQQREQQLQREQQPAPQGQRLAKSSVTPTYQRLPAPRIDGKVVAMFRRLGTTLSSEQPEEQQAAPSSRPALRIMSPAKERPRWTRELEEDEILLEFDGAIGEVLPTRARRRLSYEASSEEAEVEEVEEGEEEQQELQKETHQNEMQLLQGMQLPRGLSITLI